MPSFLPGSLVVSTFLAYLIGGIPFGYWFVRLFLRQDIRTVGSGNIGATNVHRAAGFKSGIIVLFLDILKGFSAVWLSVRLTHGDSRGMALAAVAVMLGHCYSVFLGFKGGKAVACFIGAFAYLAPLALLAALVVFITAVAFRPYISLGSITGALVFPFFYWLLSHPPRALLIASILSALLIVYRHRANIARLRAGQENVFSLKGKAK